MTSYTPQRTALEAYAFEPDLQTLLQSMVADLFQEQPKEPISYCIAWLQKEQERRRGGGGGGGTSNGSAGNGSAGNDRAGADPST